MFEDYQKKNQMKHNKKIQELFEVSCWVYIQYLLGSIFWCSCGELFVCRCNVVKRVAHHTKPKIFLSKCYVLKF